MRSGLVDIICWVGMVQHYEGDGRANGMGAARWNVVKPQESIACAWLQIAVQGSGWA